MYINNKILFLLNGSFATIIHYSVLNYMVEETQLGSTGVSSLVSSIVASFASFVGNKYIVFRIHYDPAIIQATRFTALYLIMALFHGIFLHTWSDLLGWDYRYGFLLAVIVQIVGGYLGNNYFVFKR
jgi:putative flippase GtrA